MAFHEWALTQLQKLLPLDVDSVNQVLTYTETLDKQGASDHLKNLLGDSPQALEFISSFNLRRPAPQSEAPNNHVSQPEVPRTSKHQKAKKQPFNKLPPPRRVDSPDSAGGYRKRNEEEDYMTTTARLKPEKEPPLSNTLSLDPQPSAKQLPIRSNTQHHQSPKLPPSASGPLTSDLPNIKTKSTASRTSSPKPSTTINLTGGTSMRGASTTLQDLDSAIRTLELQTNPTLSSTKPANKEDAADRARRKCPCQAQRHALLTAAPNCLSCGKIVCAYEGLGPCTFCGTPLLTRDQIHDMLRVLKEERGKERMNAHNASHSRPEVSRSPRPFTNTPQSATEGDADTSASLAEAKAQRDKLLTFQAQNAKRTAVHDEAAEFETPDVGLSGWASPAERALQLKRQQKVLREQEWNARPEWEKRRVVVSVEVGKGGGGAVRRMERVGRVEDVESDGDDELEEEGVQVKSGLGGGGRGVGGGAFARNPLLGELIRPVYNRGDIKPRGRSDGERPKRDTWRRVQDDNDDNEQWILDGGAYGDITDIQALPAEEQACA